jgi:hypothetical protein
VETAATLRHASAAARSVSGATTGTGRQAEPHDGDQTAVVM